ncbi:SpvB-domain-containing protein [Zalerion maritima]|uniref:SpvB-domain-containing protein n=1 Tax=Zalerion maritima TaxID=339359 RepID=A0AAD5WQN3_9PEZI|nr:SpvB-domain-containing protein [Zalerion maritima]
MASLGRGSRNEGGAKGVNMSWNSPGAGQPQATSSSSRATLSQASKSNPSSGGGSGSGYYASPAPVLNVPKSGGAFKSVDEKFEVNPVTGTCSLAVPLQLPAARNKLAPEISLEYDSGLGNGAFGLGWKVGIPAITRKTAKSLPKYLDDEESDPFLFGNEEDLVPKLAGKADGSYEEGIRGDYTVRSYWPLTEGSFFRIERWFVPGEPGRTHWRTISPNNVTSLYGVSSNSRIADPSDDSRIFSWLLDSTYDSRGNAIKYLYKEENSDNVDLAQANELHRTGISRSSNRYIKSIRYGNRHPNRDQHTWAILDAVADDDWMFEAVFDYDDHSEANATSIPDQAWSVRQDPYSAYCAGFEIRTYRLCRRILVFHHLKEELGLEDCLTGSMSLVYQESPTVSMLASVTQSGHSWAPGSGELAGSYRTKSFPIMELGYSRVDLSNASISPVSSSSLESLPVGLMSPYRWVDLDGAGKPDMLLARETGWYRMKNHSSVDASSGTANVLFGPAQPMPSIPSPGAGSAGMFMDVDGSGKLNLVSTDPDCLGFFERTAEGGWTEFRSFPSWPTVDIQNPNLRFLDLTGDGLADIVIAEADKFVWYRSMGTRGYADMATTLTSPSEERGARILFSDGVESLFLADLTGDGLTDLARIRNGEVCYWPNTGYGTFGAKVIMDNSPWFDTYDTGNVSGRIQLADMDGTGVSDILYFPAGGGLQVYLNRAGNGWSAAHEIASFPLLDSASQIDVVDLFGLGLHCLVWSTSLPSAGRGMCLQYLDFTKCTKPYLLTSFKTAGREMRMQYSSSTSFYEQDQASGRPWPVSLPFPLQCLSKVVTYDHLSRSYQTKKYRYHDGYFDGVEREFRGFGVSKTTTFECFLLERSASSFPGPEEVECAFTPTPPSLQVSWYNVGMWTELEQARSIYQSEFYPLPGLPVGSISLHKPDISPSKLTGDEARQAHRALKGSLIHQETFQLDGSEKESVPISMNDNRVSVTMLQPAASRAPGVFLVTPNESVAFQVERNQEDPRIQHNLTLSTDNYGNVTKSVSIAYGRRAAFRTADYTADDWAVQGSDVIVYTENDFTNDIPNLPDDYHVPAPASTRVFEVNGVAPKRASLFTTADLSPDILLSLPQKPHSQDDPTTGLRLVSRSQTRYRADDLSGLLAGGQLESLALPGESYSLAFTADMIESTFKAPGGASLLDNLSILTSNKENGAGYVDLDSDECLWVPSGRQRMGSSLEATPKEELASARSSFFQPTIMTDPFGNSQTVKYDDYCLQPVQVVDAVGNVSSVEIDYSCLQPRLATDANGNQTACTYDEMGKCVGTAVMGKPSRPTGDNLDYFQPSQTDASLSQALTKPPSGLGPDLLQEASSCSFSCFPSLSEAGVWVPGFSISIAREVHVGNRPDPPNPPSPDPRLAIGISYFDGQGRILQRRDLSARGPAGEEWVASECKVLASSGAVAREYDSFVADTPAFARPGAGVVFATHFLDSAGRPVATVLPNNTWTKATHGAWGQAEYDAGDTVGVADPFADADVGTYLQGLEEGRASAFKTQLWGASHGSSPALMGAYAGTPSTALLDPLGRPYLTVSDNGGGNRFATRLFQDIQGCVRRVVDKEGRVVSLSTYDCLGARICSTGMEAGSTWLVNDVAGSPVATLDGRGVRHRTVYDELRRPTRVFVKNVITGGGDNEDEIVAQVVEYGEQQPGAEGNNLRGKVCRTSDQALVATTAGYDLLGNPVRGTERLVKEYKGNVDWRDPAVVEMENEVFTWASDHDALGRLVYQTRTDGSVVKNTYNYRGALESVEASGSSGTGGGGTAVVKAIAYNARGQKTSVEYGNGSKTEFRHDPETFAVTAKKTVAAAGNTVQDLRYTLDCVGKIVRIEDFAQQDVYFRGVVVRPTKSFAYDALGRLVRATGREHLGQRGGASSPYGSAGKPRVESPSDGKAMTNYVETYVYSPEGNISSMSHGVEDRTAQGWTRTYQYAEPSQIEPDKHSNRLSSTSVGGVASLFSYAGAEGVAGLPTSTSEFSLLRWNLQSHLGASSKQAVSNGGTPETTYYRYDSNNRRVRKVTESYAAPGEKPVRSKDHMYMNGANIEVFRKHGGTKDAPASERWSWHVKDGQSDVLLVEASKQLDEGGGAGSENAAFEGVVSRYIVSDHIGSASLELGEDGAVISMEEFSPYGSTTYDAAAANLQVDKRYRLAGKERDKETGLYYFENRYLLPWLGRWLSPDPIGTADGLNLYCYVGCDPVNKVDPTGLNGDDPPDKEAKTNANKGADPRGNQVPLQQERAPASPDDPRYQMYRMAMRESLPYSDMWKTFADRNVVGGAARADLNKATHFPIMLAQRLAPIEFLQFPKLPSMIAYEMLRREPVPWAGSLRNVGLEYIAKDPHDFIKNDLRETFQKKAQGERVPTFFELANTFVASYPGAATSIAIRFGARSAASHAFSNLLGPMINVPAWKIHFSITGVRIMAHVWRNSNKYAIGATVGGQLAVQAFNKQFGATEGSEKE